MIKKEVKEYIHESLESLLQAVRSASNGLLDDEQMDEYKKEFSEFVSFLETQFVGSMENENVEKKILSEIPRLTPYWKLLKELHKYDGVLFKSVNEDKDATILNVASKIKDKETLAYIKEHSFTESDFLIEGEKLLVRENATNVKILKIAQFLAYCMTGDASRVVQNSKKNSPNVKEETIINRLHKDMISKRKYISLSAKRARWHELTNRAQPGRNVTDGVFFEELKDSLRCYMVFATAKNNMPTQRKQIFHYPELLNKHKELSSDRL